MEKRDYHSYFNDNINCGTHWKHLNEMLPMSTHNIMFYDKKIINNILGPCLSRTMNEFFKCRNPIIQTEKQINDELSELSF